MCIILGGLQLSSSRRHSSFFDRPYSLSAVVVACFFFSWTHICFENFIFYLDLSAELWFCLFLWDFSPVFISNVVGVFLMREFPPAPGPDHHSRAPGPRALPYRSTEEAPQFPEPSHRRPFVSTSKRYFGEDPPSSPYPFPSRRPNTFILAFSDLLPVRTPLIPNPNHSIFRRIPPMVTGIALCYSRLAI